MVDFKTTFWSEKPSDRNGSRWRILAVKAEVIQAKGNKRIRKNEKEINSTSKVKI